MSSSLQQFLRYFTLIFTLLGVIATLPSAMADAQVLAKIDPTLLSLITANEKLDSLRDGGQQEKVQTHEALIEKFYNRADFQKLWVLIELNEDPTLSLQGELSYAEATVQVQQSSNIQEVLAQIAMTAELPIDDLHYLLYANTVVAHIPLERLLNVAAISQVAWIHNGMQQLVLMDYNGPINYGLTTQGINSKLLNEINVNGANIRVGIIDSGVMHSDLDNVLTDFQDLADWDINDTDQIIDRIGHGTHTTGIVHQVAPEALLYVAAINPPDNSVGLVSQVALGLEWLLKQDVNVINLSLGYPFLLQSGKNGTDSFSYLVDKATDGYYQDTNGQFQPTSTQPIIVAAAGNSAQAHDFVFVDNGSSSIRDLYIYDWSNAGASIILYWHDNVTGTTFSVTAPNNTVFDLQNGCTTNLGIPVDQYWDGVVVCGPVLPDAARNYSLHQNGFVETWQLSILNNSGTDIGYHMEVLDSYASFDLAGLEEEMSNLLGVSVGLDPNTPRNEFDDNDKRYSTGAPSEAYQVITVGAVNEIGQLASFSSQGPMLDGRIKPDVVAPGVDIWSNYSYFIDTSFVVSSPPSPYANIPPSFHSQGYRVSPFFLAIEPVDLNPDLTWNDGVYYVLLYDSIDNSIDEWNTLMFDIDGDFGNGVIGPVQVGDIIPFMHTPQDVTLNYIDPNGQYVQVTTYLQLSGTSMAAPHIAGAAALLIDHFRSLGYDPTPPPNQNPVNE